MSTKSQISAKKKNNSNDKFSTYIIDHKSSWQFQYMKFACLTIAGLVLFHCLFSMEIAVSCMHSDFRDEIYDEVRLIIMMTTVNIK